MFSFGFKPAVRACRFNLTREDFPSINEYNDYLEKVESIGEQPIGKVHSAVWAELLSSYAVVDLTVGTAEEKKAAEEE